MFAMAKALRESRRRATKYKVALRFTVTLSRGGSSRTGRMDDSDMYSLHIGHFTYSSSCLRR